jgi:aromatic amino acid transport protein AroP
MWATPDLRLSVVMIPIWLLALAVGYRLRQRRPQKYLDR